MTVGSLGDIVFKVSSATVETLKNLSLSRGASYAKHNQHCGDTLLEFTGRDPGTVSFDMTLSADLGVNVASEISKIDQAVQSGRTMRLILGMAVYGKKWVISKYSVKYNYFDRNQNPLLAEISLSLTEYS
ncbi:MAG: phage tail protein [Firmicutes bacterium]|nr:phage tail protein [[Eubacterium] siraeum]MCM1486779.1 phage tail protein [Bacillota bacterium]